MKLLAPVNFGEFRFDGWQVDGCLIATTNPVLQLATRPDGRFASHSPVSKINPKLSHRLAPAHPGPAGQFGLAFDTVAGRRYWIEQSARLQNPIWGLLESRSGDGNPAQLLRPAAIEATRFFRVIFEP